MLRRIFRASDTLELPRFLRGQEAQTYVGWDFTLPYNAHIGDWRSGPSYSMLDRDVLSTLQNLGCAREEAVRKVKEQGHAKGYFRAALGLVR